VRCLDAPGFGTENERLSPRSISEITDDLRERFLSGRGQAAGTIVGISLGGMVALDWAGRHRTDFERCVVINTSAADSPPLQRLRPAAFPTMLARRLRSNEAQERAILAISSNSTALDREAIARLWTAWASERPPQKASITNQVAAVRRFRPPAELSIPLLVLASRADRLVSYRCSQRIARWLNAPLRLHQDAGHDLPLDDPEWICSQIANWSAGA
jgi:pimeloyl-ACP methyl ester carboxylesterase